MRVLISAYACEPDAGSEMAKGWNFAYALALQGHDVTVLTCGSHHRHAIERYCMEHQLPRQLSFAWHDIPGRDGPGYKHAKNIRRHYYMWQMTARGVVSRLNAEQPFDVIHHLTWTVLRWPSFLGGLGPRFIFGPVGGGEATPWRLRRGFPSRGWKVEIQRDILNVCSRFDPMVWHCLSKADAILVTDHATYRHVPLWWHNKTSVVADIYAPSATSPPAQIANATSKAPSILFVGRLEYWKGVQLALAAVARVHTDIPDLTFTITGEGPEEGYLRRIAADLGIEKRVQFTGRVPHSEMHRLYAKHDLFVFPSLHDSAAQVIGEAMAQGLPVICLDLGGSSLAIDPDCGVVISTRGKDRGTVEQQLADAIAHAVMDKNRLARLKQGSLERAGSFTCQQRAHRMVEQFYKPTLSDTDFLTAPSTLLKR